MATKTIAQLTAASGAAGTNLFEIDDGSGHSYKLTAAQMLAYIQGAGVFQKSPLITLDDSSQKYSFTHGLGSTPTFFKAILVCIVADGNMVTIPGDVVDLNGWYNTGLSCPAWTLFATSSMIELATSEALVGLEGDFSVMEFDTGGATSPSSFNNFKLQFIFAP